MSRIRFDELAAWVVPRLPKRFQEGRLPYLFFIVWLLIGVMVVLAFITPYPNGVPVPLAFAFVLLVLQLLFIWGMPLQAAVNLGLLAGLMQVSYAAWMSGGIFSPRMAWMTAIPLIPFYAISRLTGLVWMLVCCVFNWPWPTSHGKVGCPLTPLWAHRKSCRRLPVTRWSRSSSSLFRSCTTTSFVKPTRPVCNATSS